MADENTNTDNKPEDNSADIAELRKQLAAANQGNAEMRKELDTLKNDRKAEREEMMQRLEQKGENERLVEELKADNAKLRMSEDKAKTYEKMIDAQVAAAIKDIPEEYHEDINAVPLERRLAFAERLRAGLAPPKSPDLGGDAGSTRVAKDEPIQLNEDEQQVADIFGFNPKDYKATMDKAMTGVVERSAGRQEAQLDGQAAVELGA